MSTSATTAETRRQELDLMQDVIIIEAGRAERHYWLDLWRYRELFRVLAWRDLSVRYKQTVIGVLWALIRPFLTLIVFTIIFGRIAKLPTDGNAPYATDGQTPTSPIGRVRPPPLQVYKLERWDYGVLPEPLQVEVL